jgi:hypothetical protein
MVMMLGVSKPHSTEIWRWVLSLAASRVVKNSATVDLGIAWLFKTDSFKVQIGALGMRA